MSDQQARAAEVLAKHPFFYSDFQRKAGCRAPCVWISQNGDRRECLTDHTVHVAAVLADEGLLAEEGDGYLREERDAARTAYEAMHRQVVAHQEALAEIKDDLEFERGRCAHLARVADKYKAAHEADTEKVNAALREYVAWLNSARTALFGDDR